MSILQHLKSTQKIKMLCISKYSYKYKIVKAEQSNKVYDINNRRFTFPDRYANGNWRPMICFQQCLSLLAISTNAMSGKNMLHIFLFLIYDKLLHFTSKHTHSYVCFCTFCLSHKFLIFFHPESDSLALTQKGEIRGWEAIKWLRPSWSVRRSRRALSEDV